MSKKLPDKVLDEIAEDVVNLESERLLRSREYRALVVDNTEYDRLLTRGALEGAGFEVIEAHTSREASERDLSKLDVIVSEVDLSGIKKFLGKVKETSIIAFYSSMDYRKDDFTWLADVYVLKKQGLRELMRKIREEIVHNSRENYSLEDNNA